MSATTWIYVFIAILLDGCAALVAGLIPERWLEHAREPMIKLKLAPARLEAAPVSSPSHN